MASIKHTSTVVAVVGMLLLAGCSGFMPGGQSSGSAGEPLHVDAVPNEASSVMYFNSSIVYDDTTESIMNNVLEKLPNESDTPSSYQEILTEAKNESNVSFEKFNDATIYTKAETMNEVQSSGADGETYFGVIVSSEWSEDEFTTVMNENTKDDNSLQESSYNGQTLYVSSANESDEKLYIGVRDDGRFVLGTEQAVKDALDVSAGDSDPISGTVRSQLLENKNAFVSFASKMPETNDTVAGGQAFNQAEYISGAYYAEDDTIGLEVLMDFPSADNASIVADQARGVLATGESQVENETIRNHISKVSIDVSEQMVSVEYESSVTEFNNLVDTAYEQYYSPFLMGSVSASSSTVSMNETTNLQAGVTFQEETTGADSSTVDVKLISKSSGVEYIQVESTDAMANRTGFTDVNSDGIERELELVGDIGTLTDIDRGETIYVYAYGESGERQLLQSYTVAE